MHVRALFIAQAVLTVALAVRMVTTQRLVRSLALHVVTLFLVGLIYLTVGATFMGTVQITVYAGSVTILLVFALMMTPLGQGQAGALDHQSRLRAAVVALAVLGVAAYALTHSATAVSVIGPTGIVTVARELFKNYVYPFEVLSLVLLIALVGVGVVAGGVSALDEDQGGVS